MSRIMELLVPPGLLPRTVFSCRQMPFHLGAGERHAGKLLCKAGWRSKPSETLETSRELLNQSRFREFTG